MSHCAREASQDLGIKIGLLQTMFKKNLSFNSYGIPTTQTLTARYRKMNGNGFSILPSEIMMEVPKWFSGPRCEAVQF